MYLLTANYSQSPSVVEPHVPAHSAWVKKYLESDVILFAGPKKSGLGGVIAMRQMEKSKLREILAEDPYVIEDVADYDIVEFDCKATHPDLALLKG